MAWLLEGTPPALWDIGCLHRDILPPTAAQTGPYARKSVAASVASPKGGHWRPNHPTQNQEVTTTLAPLLTQQNGSHKTQGPSIPPMPDASLAPQQEPHHAEGSVDKSPSPRIHRKNTTKPGGQPPTYLLDKADINIRKRLASRRFTSRNKQGQPRPKPTHADGLLANYHTRIAADSPSRDTPTSSPSKESS